MRKEKRFLKDITLINNYGERVGKRMRGDLEALIKSEINTSQYPLWLDREEGMCDCYIITGVGGADIEIALNPDNVGLRLAYHRPHPRPQHPRFVVRNYDKTIKKWLRANKRWLWTEMEVADA